MMARRATQSQVDADAVSVGQVHGASCHVTGSTTVGTARSVASAVSMELRATQLPAAASVALGGTEHDVSTV